jgi:oligoribonuclease NrnB/cAMP/cGMP phosphodiesterase (DHH superfamily)
MKKIPTDSKILSISHNDFDGAVCQILLGNVYKNITYLPVSFYRVDSIIKNLNFDEYDYVFLTDVHPEDEDLLNISEKMILIDHHNSAINAHCPEKNHYVISKPDKCASFLVKKFLETMYDVQLTHLNNIVYLVNDYDCWLLKNPKSKHMNDLMFVLYRPTEFVKNFMDGRTRFTEKELTWLKTRKHLFNKIYNELEVTELEKVSGCVIFTEDFVNELADRLLHQQGYKIVFIINMSSMRVSVRHQIDELDMGKILKEKGWGGGHAVSAGFFLDKNLGYEKDFNNKIGILQEIISSGYPHQF